MVYLAGEICRTKRKFDQILKFRSSCTYPSSPIWAKFGVRQYTHGVLFLANFCLDHYVLSFLRGEEEYRGILPNFQIWGAPVPTPFTDHGQMWRASVDQQCTLHAKVHLSRYVLLHITMYNHAHLTHVGNFRGVPVPTPAPLSIRIKYDACECTHGLRLDAKFHLDQ